MVGGGNSILSLLQTKSKALSMKYTMLPTKLSGLRTEKGNSQHLSVQCVVI